MDAQGSREGEGMGGIEALRMANILCCKGVLLLLLNKKRTAAVSFDELFASAVATFAGASNNECVSNGVYGYPSSIDKSTIDEMLVVVAASLIMLIGMGMVVLKESDDPERRRYLVTSFGSAAAAEIAKSRSWNSLLLA